MKFRYTITKNNTEIAGFNDCNTAYIVKDFMRNVNRMAGYKDRFQITDTQSQKECLFLK